MEFFYYNYTEELISILESNDLDKTNKLKQFDLNAIIDFLNDKEINDETKVLLLSNIEEKLSLDNIELNED